MHICATGEDITAVRADVHIARDFAITARAVVAVRGSRSGSEAIAAVGAYISVRRDRVMAVRAVILVISHRIGGHRSVDVNVPDIGCACLAAVIIYSAGTACGEITVNHAANASRHIDGASVCKADGELICLRICYHPGDRSAADGFGLNSAVGDIKIGCAGSYGLIVLSRVEGGINTPAIHVGRYLPKGEVGSVISVKRSIREGQTKALCAVFSASGCNKCPFDRGPYVCIGDKESGLSCFMELIGRLLGHHQYGILHRDDPGSRHRSKRKLCRPCVRSQGRHQSPAEDTVAFGKAVFRYLRSKKPVKAGAASCSRCQSIDPCSIVCIGRNDVTGSIGKGGNILISLVVHLTRSIGGVFNGIALFLDGALGCAYHCCRDSGRIVKEIIPCIISAVVEGVSRGRNEIGERSPLWYMNVALIQSFSVFGDFPGIQSCVAPISLYRGGQQLQFPIVVKIRHRIRPHAGVILLDCIEIAE